MKRFFHNELEEFRSNIVLMGERCIEIVRDAVRALQEFDHEQAKAVLEKDDAIDSLEVMIDTEAVRYISLRSPVASELRLLTVGMKVSNDLERVGDESCTIAKRALKLAAGVPVKELHNIPLMARKAMVQLREAIDSFLEGDINKARSIPVRDREIDALHKENYEIITRQIKSSPEDVHRLLDLIFISKSLERIADHATNIAEEVIYLFSGEDVRHSPEVKEYKNLP